MKKFVIISVALLLLAAGAFGYSMYHYLQVTGVITASSAAPTQSASGEVQAPVPQEPVGETLGALPATGTDTGIFAENFDKASTFVSSLSKEQMVGQLLLGVCADTTAISTEINRYSLGGMLFENGSFAYSTAEEIKQTLDTASGACTVKPIFAAQEEGGSRVTFSDSLSDYNFDTRRSEFESSGLQGVEKSEESKAEMLKSLGVNLNLAPSVDLAQEGDQIMYSRSISSDVATVSAYAEYCAKFTQAKGVSVALKHFPGYGTLTDDALATATSLGQAVTDDRAAETIRTADYEPFRKGAEAGAHFIMVSNVVVQNIDAAHTAALSPAIHAELRNNVGFSGVIITDLLDDMDYSAYADGKKPVVQAVLAGNDMILVRDYAAAYTDILAAVNDGTISEQQLTDASIRVIAYKYTAGIME